MMGGSWRRFGVYRITLELPMPTWRAVVQESDRLGLKPSQLLRAVLAERFAVTSDDPPPSGGQEPPA